MKVRELKECIFKNTLDTTVLVKINDFYYNIDLVDIDCHKSDALVLHLNKYDRE